jgi:NAD-dependent SIR2 family protein deacetylase
MKTLHYKELIKLFNDFKNNPQEKFCFLLGAGASKTSGIPTGSELAWQWYQELKKAIPHELKKLV